MQSHWIPTNAYYHRIIAEPDAEKKQALFDELFVQPWAQMLSVTGQMTGAASPQEAAQRSGWLMPEQLDTVPEQLALLEETNAWEIAAQALAEGAARFAPYIDQHGVEAVTGWLLLSDPAQSNPFSWGYSGAMDYFQPRFMVNFSAPDSDNIHIIPGLIVHEMHHLVRLKVFPWHPQTITVGDWMIHEGLAESFAACMYGDDIVGKYVTAFEDSELATAQSLLADSLDKTGFDTLRGYVFGDPMADHYGFEKVGMPLFGGYAIGYRVVRAYLDRSGCSIEEATFKPSEEIIESSGFFA